MSYTHSELGIGQTARLERVFTEDDLRKCNELTRDFNPLYERPQDGWDKNFTKPIVPGLLVEGLISQVITDKLPGSACLLLQKELIYYHPVHVGDAITAELLIMDINHERNWVTIKVTCFNQNETEVIKGQVVIYVLPGG
ncbi:MaoC/PaaZ C-terminal domain-containing protein [Bacillus sp. FJAT-27251]|uniref:MaoC/PaaZ C-terminal domain-containing protein n=1 Tax=Bacillus sp. FJAT-27251 TaxID=1684142 RepID=UPI0006A769D8|nr:MaoC/PaaZ C-terminal domain-containing protein [Bacillus sp. FJAT-27251]